MSWYDPYHEGPLDAPWEGEGFVEARRLVDNNEAGESFNEPADQFGEFGLEELISYELFDDLPAPLDPLPDVHAPAQAGEVQPEAGEAQPQDIGIHEPHQEILEITCPYCNRDFTNKKARTEHTKAIHIGTRCFWSGCGEVVETEQELRDHTRLTHQPICLADTQYQCTWTGMGNNPEPCNRIFVHVSSARRCALAHQRWALEQQP